MADFKRDVFEPELKFTLEESSEVDGVHILGKVKGQFFVPEGISRNKRYYTKGLWEKTLKKENIREKLKDRRMFGTISHEQKLDDVALLEGKFSHIVTDLRIDADGKGVGEALILNTPAGQILNTVLRAGSKLFVSSRADGDFNGTYQGIPKVDEDKYTLETFDFVLDPGFLQANPRLAENFEPFLNYLYQNNDEDLNSDKKKDIKEDHSMENKLIESLTTDKIKLTEQLTNVLAALEVEKAEKTTMASEFSTMKEKLEKVEESAGKLALYERLGTAEDVEKAMDTSLEKIKAYEALGTMEEIEKVFAVAESKNTEQAEQYKELGTPEEITAAFAKVEETLTAYAALGSAEEIEHAISVGIQTVESYKRLGSVDEINCVLEKFDVMADSLRRQVSESKIKALAKECGVEEAVVRKVYGKMMESEIKELFKDVPQKTSSKLTEKFRVPEKDTKKDEKDDSKLNIRDRGTRMLEQFSR